LHLCFSNSCHVGWMSGLPDTILKGGHQRTKQSLVPIVPVVSEMKIFKFHPPFLFLVTATKLVGDRDCRAQFWKGITNGPFQDGRCYYLLTIPCTLSRMQGFTCLIKSYKTNMF
jgi:hypothetical protein